MSTPPDMQWLVSRYFNGTITASEGKLLSQWVKADPANARELAIASLLHRRLYDLLSPEHALRQLDAARASDTLPIGTPALSDPADDPAPSPLEATRESFARPATPFQSARQRSGLTRFWKLAVAAVVLLAGAAAVVVFLSSRTGSAPATFADAIGAQWGPGAVPALHQKLPAGPLYLKSGLARLTLDNGVLVVLQGPTRFRIVSPALAALDEGKLTASVPHAARGFAVRTPSATVVDLGTEFGVEAAADHSTHVAVFRGTVRAGPVDASGSAGVLTLKQGQAAAVAPNAAVAVRESPAPLTFVRPDEFADRTASNAGPAYERWLAYSYHLRQDPDLVAYYTFDGASKSTRQLPNRADATAGKYDGTIEGATWDWGRLPGKPALRFNGKDSRVAVNLPQKLPAFTLAAWVQFDRFDHEFNALMISRGPRSGGKIHWQIRGDGKLDFAIADPAKEKAAFWRSVDASYVNPADGRWWFLVATYDAATGGRWYVNGQPMTQTPAPGPAFGRVGPAWIGDADPQAAESWPDRGLDGRIDELAIFSRALSPSEVAEMYKAGGG